MTYVPFFLHIKPHERIVLIGGGHIAMAKAESLRSVQGALHVVAEDILPELEAMVTKQGGTVTRASYDASQLLGAKIVIAATDDARTNHTIQRDAAAQHILVNVVDTPGLCDFIFPAVVERGDIKIAISTAGISPTLARLVKRKIELLLPWNFAMLAEWVSQRRATVRHAVQNIQARRLFWEGLLEGRIAQEVLAGNDAKAEYLFQCDLKNTATFPRGALGVVQAPQGNSDQLTLQAARMLSQADVIIYDALIAPDMLGRFARKDAQKIAAPQYEHEIEALLENHVSRNRIVVRLVSNHTEENGGWHAG